MKEYRGISTGVDFKGSLKYGDLIELQKKATAVIESADSRIKIHSGMNVAVTSTGLSITEGIVLWGGFPATFEGVSGISVDSAKFLAIVYTDEDYRSESSTAYYAYRYYQAIITSEVPGSVFQGKNVLGVIPMMFKADDCPAELVPYQGIGSEGDVELYMGCPSIVRVVSNTKYLQISGLHPYEEKYKDLGPLLDGFIYIGYDYLEFNYINSNLKTSVTDVPTSGKLRDIVGQLAKNVNDLAPIAYNGSFDSLEEVPNDIYNKIMRLNNFPIGLPTVGKFSVEAAISMIISTLDYCRKATGNGDYRLMSNKPVSLSELYNDIDFDYDGEVRMIESSKATPVGWVELTGPISVAGTSFVNFIPKDTVTDVTVKFIKRVKPTYTISGAITGQGFRGVTPFHCASGNIVVHKSNVTLYAIPTQRTQFKKWVVGGVDNTNWPLSLTLTGDITVDVEFEEVYEVVLASSDTTGSNYVSFTTLGYYKGVRDSRVKGTTIKAHAQVNEPGTYFKCFIVNGNEVAASENIGNVYAATVTINEDTSILAVFENYPSVTIEINDPLGGNVVNETGNSPIGSQIKLVATPNEGYDFVHYEWTIGGVTKFGYSATQWVELAAGKNTIKAVFSKVVSFTARTKNLSTDQGTITVNGESGSSKTISLKQGDSVVLNAQPTENYVFVVWYSNLGNKAITPSVTVEATVDEIYTAVFSSKICSITTSSSPVGVADITGDGDYTSGAAVVLKCVPHVGYIFKKWQKYVGVFDPVDVSTNSEYDFEASEDALYSAVCEVETHSVNITVDPAGTGTVTGAGVYNYGTIVALKATPALYYKFKGWYIDEVLVSTLSSYNVTVKSDVIVKAEFERMTVTINAACDPQAGGYVTGAGVYNMGEQVLLQVTANAGHSFTGWYDNGEYIGDSVNLEFTALSDVNLIAKFTN
jgi:hypothetical protein